MVLTLSGCPTGGTVSLDELPAEIAEAQCGFATRCGTGFDTYEQYALREQITDCNAQLAAFFESTALGPIRNGVADGSIVFHGDIASACVAAYRNAPCGGSAAPSACLETFEGTLADGAPCSNAEQCSDQSTCDSSHVGMCPSGVCIHVPQVGETCDTSGSAATRCAYGLRCSSGTCAELAMAGEACNPSQADCDASLTCVTTETDPTHGTCGTITLAGAGEPCGRGCQAGLLCSASTGMCRQPRTDGSCESTFGGVDDCGVGEQCNVETGNCEPLPTTGEPCTTLCARGSRCTPTGSSGGVCAVPVATGSACETDASCASGYCASGACAAPPLCRPS